MSNSNIRVTRVVQLSAYTTASDQVSNTNTEILTILTPIREAEGPENVRMKMVTLKAPKDRHR